MGKYVNNSRFSHITWINKQRMNFITEHNEKQKLIGGSEVKVKPPNYTNT